MFVSVLARTPRASASASVVARGRGATTRTCGTPFVDTASSALLADVVLEGRVREKVYRPGGSEQDQDQPGGAGRYNVSIQVRKRIWKGRELVNKGRKPRKLLLGTFAPPRDSPAEATDDNDDDGNSNRVAVVSRPAAASRGGAGGSAGVVADGDGDGDGVVHLLDCVADVSDGATYIFFLRDVGDRKGRYFELSALPVKKTRRDSRIVSKILKKDRGKFKSAVSTHSAGPQPALMY